LVACGGIGMFVAAHHLVLDDHVAAVGRLEGGEPAPS
jgi:hypothetical protein